MMRESITAREPAMTDNQEPITADMKSFVPVAEIMNAESERGRVLVAASFLDDLLRQILAAYLIKGKSQTFLMAGSNSPFGSFASRLEGCAALGLISKDERDECDLIKRIRNDFAHQVAVSFDDDKIANKCRELKMRALPEEGETFHAFSAFVSAAAALILTLSMRPLKVKENPAKQIDWPRAGSWSTW